MAKTYTISCLSILAAASTASAVVTTVHQYELGEPGTIIDIGSEIGVAQATLGSSFTNDTFGGGLAVGSVNPSPVSSFYAIDAGPVSQGGNFGANHSAFATDNFGIEMWVRTSDVSQSGSFFGTAGSNTGSVNFLFLNGGWAATIQNVTWIGDNPNAGGNTQTAVADKWTHLAVIRDGGVSTFYIDGVAQAGTSSSSSITHGTAHLGLTSGASNGFIGDYDALRLFTFGDEDDPVAALTLVPEPSTVALLGLGGFALLLRRRY